MVARSAAIFEVPISEAIRTFAPSSPNVGGTIVWQEGQGPVKTPSPDPLPVPPQVVTPFLQDILRPVASPTLTFLPAYSPPNSPQYIPHTPSLEIMELGELPAYSNELVSLQSGKLTPNVSQDQQQVLGGVKHCEWSRRPPRNMELRKGARLGPMCIGLALIRPLTCTMVSGRRPMDRSDHCCCRSRTPAWTSILRNNGHTGPLNKFPELLRLPTHATQAGGQVGSYTELSEEGTLGEKGGKANLISVM
jgi:hypothetical protein